MHSLVLGGKLKAWRDPDVVYGDIDLCDKDCSSYFKLHGFAMICEEDGCSVGDELEEELHLESPSCDFSCQSRYPV